MGCTRPAKWTVLLVAVTGLVVVAGMAAVDRPVSDWEHSAMQSRVDGSAAGERLQRVATSGSAPTEEPAWPMGRANAANTNHINTTGPTNPITVRWTFATDANKIKAGPVVVNGTVYFGAQNSSNGLKFYAVDAWTGEKRWAVETPGANHIAVFRNTIYVGSGGRLYALDAATGDIFWEFSTKGRVSGLTVADRTLYVASTGTSPGMTVPDGRVYALKALRGEPKWRFTTDKPTTGVAVKEGTTYVTTRYGDVYALDAETGSKRWNVVVKDGKWLNTPSVANNTVYIGSKHLNARPSDHGYLFALDIKTGEERWQRSKRGKPIPSPSLLGNTAYYRSNYLHAVNGQTGDDRWSKRSLKRTPVLLNDIGYVRTNKTLHTLDPETGASHARWRPERFNNRWDRFRSPMAVLNGSLYTGVGYDVRNDEYRTDITVVYALGTPEFTYSNLSVTPSAPGINEPVNVTATVRNTGTGPGEINATFAVDGNVTNTTAARLDPRTTTTVTFAHTFTRNGTYTVTVANLTRRLSVGDVAPAPTPTLASQDTPGSPTPTEPAGPTPPTESPSTTTAATTTVTSGAVPGFGVGVGLVAVALVVGMLGLWRRR